MKKWAKLTLLAIFLLAITIRVLPLFRYSIWGSDTGEYYFITSQLIRDGYISTDYDGWGFGYPYFPGMFYICASFHFLTGFDPLYSLIIIVPIIASLSVLITFILARMICKNDVYALVAAGLISVVMPHVFTTSHPMPGSIGDMLFVTSLLLFLMMFKNKKYAVLLLLTAFSLIITHHLSTYFLFIFLIGAILFQGIAGDLKRKKIRDGMLFIIFLYTVMMIYWLIIAKPFGDRVIGKAFPLSKWVIAILGYIALISIFVVLHLRKGIKWRYKPKYPETSVQLIKYVALLLVLLTLLFFLAFTNIPGTNIRLESYEILMFSPFLVICAFCAVGPGYLKFYENGLAVYGWIFAGLLSAFVGIVTESHELLPYRHTQYLIVPLVVLVGVGAGILIFMLVGDGGKVNTEFHSDENSTRDKSRKNWKKTVSWLIIALLICPIAFTAYPSKDTMGGFQEGTTEEDIRSTFWLKNSVGGDTTIASDHRMSSMIYGFANLNASWDSAHDTLHSSTFEGCRDELEGLSTPSGEKEIDYVLLTDDIKSGAALLQWENAEPMSSNAQKKFESSPFIKVYESEKAEVYLVSAF